MIYAVPATPLCAAYCNTVLANLNARVYIAREEAPQTVDMDLFPNSSVPVSDNTRTDQWQGDTHVGSRLQEVSLSRNRQAYLVPTKHHARMFCKTTEVFLRDRIYLIPQRRVCYFPHYACGHNVRV